VNIHKLLQKVSVTFDGSILLGKHVACDTFQKGRSLAVFTHIHADHMVGFGSALGALGTDVLVSVPTRDLLVAIEGKHLLRRTNFIALNWGSSHTCNEESVTLHPSKHILGSSQVSVEDQEGHRLVYTGDFNSNTQPIDADVLVVDAIYGTLRRNYTASDLYRGNDRPYTEATTERRARLPVLKKRENPTPHGHSSQRRRECSLYFHL